VFDGECLPLTGHSPSGTKCADTLPTGWPSWGAVTTCVPTSQHSPVAAVQAVPTQGKCVCKPGPPLAASTTLKNVLVIGDSVSLGYTPVLTKLMEKTALVQCVTLTEFQPSLF